MGNSMDFETKQKILNEFYRYNRKSVKCRILAAAAFFVSWQLVLRRKGFLWWLFLPGFFVTAVLVLMAGMYRYERSRCPFCGASLGYMASKTDYTPWSCPKCGEKL